jgi:hypothetical protein
MLFSALAGAWSSHHEKTLFSKPGNGFECKDGNWPQRFGLLDMKSPLRACPDPAGREKG